MARRKRTIKSLLFSQKGAMASFVFILLLLLLLLPIHGESLGCPDSFHFDCPDNVYNGSLLTRFFTNPTLNHDQSCDGPCELTCDDYNHTMIQCAESDPPYQVLYMDPSNATIAVDYPLNRATYLNLEDDLCKAYGVLRGSFASFQSVSLTGWGENETFLGCPYPKEDDYWDGDHYKLCREVGAIVYGPYDHARVPAKEAPSDCMQVRKYVSPSNQHHVKRLIILCTVLPGVAIIISIIFLIYWYRPRNNKSGSSPYPPRIISLNHTRSDIEEGTIKNGVTIFSYAELQQVTNNFDPARELGEGGFGVVYYGKLEDGREVAVKRMYEKNYKQVEQFKNEIKILTNTRHQNLVTLYGSTSRHTRELLLVYEYISNGTVADHLHGHQSKSVFLLWPTRMKIAIETATALSYLHYNDIIHRDIKTNNILLDKHFHAKVADFGLSRLFPPDMTHVSTAPQGTPGYLDPEYHQCYHLTDKSDVYSFGVVLIELVSSLPAIDMERDGHEVNLSSYAMNKLQCSALDELVDVNLGYEKSFKVRRMVGLVAELAFRCLQHEREVRPTMEEVLEGLKGIEGVDYGALEEEEEVGKI